MEQNRHMGKCAEHTRDIKVTNSANKWLNTFQKQKCKQRIVCVSCLCVVFFVGVVIYLSVVVVVCFCCCVMFICLLCMVLGVCLFV